MKFSQNIIAYHSCGKCYLDGTIEIAYFGCSNKTFNPFWKTPIDAKNKISKSTRSQIKKKPVATRKYIRKYFNYLLYLEHKTHNQVVIITRTLLIMTQTQMQKQTQKLKLHRIKIQI